MSSAFAVSGKELSTPEYEVFEDEAAEILGNECTQLFSFYIRGDSPKSFFFAIDPSGEHGCGWKTFDGTNKKRVTEKALKNCEVHRALLSLNSPCLLLAQDNEIVGKITDFPLMAGMKGFSRAISLGMVRRIVGYLDDGLNIDARTPDGETPLMAVAAQGDYEVYIDLLQRGATRSLKRNNGSNLLIAAVSGRNIKIIRDVLEHKISPNEQDIMGNTALHVAGGINDLYVIQLLMLFDGDLNIKNIKGDSVASIVDRIGADYKTVGKSYTFLNAIKRGDVVAMKSLYAKLSEKDRTNVLRAGILFEQNEHLEAYALLLELGANPNEKANLDFTPLIFAAGTKKLKIAQMLVEAGADKLAADADGRTAMDYAFSDAMRTLLE